MAQIRNRPELDQVLNEAKRCSNFIERADWLILLFDWIRKGTVSQDAGKDPRRLPVIRLKFLLTILDRNPEWKESFVKNIRTLFFEVEATNCLTDVGLGNQAGFLQELGERLVGKILPSTPLKGDFSSLLAELFPDESDIAWLELVDDELFEKFVTLLKNGGTEHDLSHRFQTQALDAKSFLISQVRSFGLSAPFRERTNLPAIRTSPFFYLVELDSHLKLQSSEEPLSFHQLIEECEALLGEVNQYLDRHGVSISLIFQIERTKRQIHRLRLLQDLIEGGPTQSAAIRSLIRGVAHTAISNQSVYQLFKDNYELLTKKVVDRNSEIGEHYMATTSREAFKMFKKAAGGGMLTALTVCLKTLIYMLPFAPFMTGFVQSINYSVSFLAIQFLGFTLATKQPASTAAALASKIEGAEKSGFANLVESIFAILRAQIVSVFGNIAAVIPAVLALNLLYFYAAGRDFMTHKEAEHILESTDILGPCAIYAAFTGVLLFSSSLFAGWVDNWFIYRDVAERISQNHKIRSFLGIDRAARVAAFLKNNMAALAANISLGFLLGLVPTFLKFAGIPLDVRHVTLSTGAFAIALAGLDTHLWHSDVVRAALGIGIIGILNISISFYLALKFALSAKKVNAHKRRVIYLRFFSALARQPWRLFWPQKPEEAKASTAS